MRFIRKATIILGAMALVAMVVITCAEVILRYFFNSPVFGSAEMIQMLLGVVVFGGMFAVTRDRGHVNVSLFEPLLLKHFRRGYRGIFDVMTLVGTVGVAGILVWRVWDLTHYPENSIVLRLPMIWIIAAMAGLAALAIVAAFAAMREDPRKSPPHSPQSDDPQSNELS
ncbi:TRAP transporter small permease subunit [Phaeobacter sp. J2-8]|uniref:TRAP transporter small permease n=1 Tax=Phaeobacter sp. J2-8 TaxID=2931394 RepID=UPI001FD34E0A|nr:TRAP transporter small permease subunit [Phaeobacter sp. J2-8]MCJ7873246.1 TRAP transporter small permease subunit [Phaeobacter sp. J2-8]